MGQTRVIGYLRVSTDYQADEGVSLAAQRAKLEAYADLYGLELVAVYEDGGHSAKTLNRPALQAALAALEAGQAEGLLVAKLDRLSRSVVDMGTLVNRYFQRHALYSVGEQIDTSSASGRLVLNLLTTVAQWEREAIGERTSDALTHLKAKGVKLGGECLGWQRTEATDEDGRRIVADIEREVSTVERIVELREAGLSLRAIAAALTDEGHATKRGGRWQANTVRKVLARAA